MTRPIGNRILSFSLASLPAHADGSVVVRDFVLSHGIEGREPVSNTDSFRVEDGRAFAFARIHNSGGPTSVRFVWHYGTTHHATVPVTIGQSPGWRTWSTAKLRPGNWRVALVDRGGEVLLEKAFTVAPNAATPMAMEPDGTQDGMSGAAGMGPAGSDTPASVVYPTR
jgi:hypothetical protein